MTMTTITHGHTEPVLVDSASAGAAASVDVGELVPDAVVVGVVVLVVLAVVTVVMPLVVVLDAVEIVGGAVVVGVLVEVVVESAVVGMVGPPLVVVGPWAVVVVVSGGRLVVVTSGRSVIEGGVIGSVVMGGRVVVVTDDSRGGNVTLGPDPLLEHAAIARVPNSTATPTNGTRLLPTRRAGVARRSTVRHPVDLTELRPREGLFPSG
jgi:hypothetical protein